RPGRHPGFDADRHLRYCRLRSYYPLPGIGFTYQNAFTMSTLQIADRHFSSRLFLGTGKFGSLGTMREAIKASGSELVTMALKRVDHRSAEDELLEALRLPQVSLLPNTSGARDAREAVLAAQLAREAMETNWVKLEIHPDPRYLLPDPVETLRATEELAKMG